MLYENVKAMICSPVGDTDFCHIFAGVLQDDTLVLYMFNISKSNK